MKKLESLNNSLFEKFESKKVHNLAALTGGVVKATVSTKTEGNPNGTDEFTPSDGPGKGTSAVEMNFGNGLVKGDLCKGMTTAGPNLGGMSGMASFGGLSAY